MLCLTSWPSTPGRAAPGRYRDISTAARYGVKLLAIGGDANFVSASINSRGIVVAWAQPASVKNRAVVDASGVSTELLPAGYTQSAALGIDVAGDVLVTAWKGKGLNDGARAAFVTHRVGKRWHWRRLRARPGFEVWRATGMAANGDVCGYEVAHGKRRPEHAVVWLAEGDRYGLPLALGGRLGFIGTEADAIWSHGHEVALAGQLAPQGNAQAVLWAGIEVPRPRPYLDPDGAGLVPETIGGGGRPLYLASNSATGEYDIFANSYVQTIHVDRTGRATVGARRTVPWHAEEVNRVTGVSADPAGNPVSVGIGLGPGKAALICRGIACSTLQREVASSFQGRLQGAFAINPNGEIVAAGTIYGKAAAFVLSPTGR